MRFSQGDVVTEFCRGDIKRISKIEKITPTGRIKIKGNYYRPDGNLISSDAFQHGHIELTTQEHVNTVRKTKLVRFLKDRPWKDDSLELLEKVYVLVGQGE